MISVEKVQTSANSAVACFTKNNKQDFWNNVLWTENLKVELFVRRGSVIPAENPKLHTNSQL